MNSINFIFYIYLFIQIVNNLCTAYPYYENELMTGSEYESKLMPAFSQSGLHQLGQSGDGSIKNADDLKDFIQKLQKIVAIMGKPRFGRDLSHESKYDEQFENKNIKNNRKYKILKR